MTKEQSVFKPGNLPASTQSKIEIRDLKISNDIKINISILQDTFATIYKDKLSTIDYTELAEFAVAAFHNDLKDFKSNLESYVSQMNAQIEYVEMFNDNLKLNGDDSVSLKLIVEDVIIGLHLHERCVPQTLTIYIDGIDFHPYFKNGNLFDSKSKCGAEVLRITELTRIYLQSSNSYTVEHLVDSLLRFMAFNLKLRCDSIKIVKTRALRPAVLSITQHQKYPSIDIPCDQALIGIGTNLGNRVSNIHNAIRLLDLKVVNSSFLYESANAYTDEEQGPFLNCVIQVIAPSPMQLFELCKKVEISMGRDLSASKFSSRIIDLDILVHGAGSFKNEQLIIPHPRMLERDFVLMPLSDMFPLINQCSSTKLGPSMGENFESSFAIFEKCGHSSKIRPLETKHEKLFAKPERFFPHTFTNRTLLMGVVNATPDSFSDGGETNFELKINELVSEGANIIDIGGQSTRPGAEYISLEEEMNRVLPLVIFAKNSFPNANISVDTFRPSVAEKAILEGADIINDVSGGRLDDMGIENERFEMFKVVAKYQVPYVLMHSRGTPATMQNLNQYPEGLLSTVCSEIQQSIQFALRLGVLRWNIIVDPGIGFAKSSTQNVELIRKFNSNYPVLFGPSRKSFIGAILSQSEPKERDLGTIGAVCASISNNASIVRIHNVKLVRDAVKVADAIMK